MIKIDYTTYVNPNTIQYIQERDGSYFIFFSNNDKIEITKYIYDKLSKL